MTRVPRQFNGERAVFSTPILRKVDVCVQKNEVGPLLKPHIKMNSKWIKDLTARCKHIKFLDKNIGNNLRNTRFGNNFLALTQKAQGTKIKID